MIPKTRNNLQVDEAGCAQFVQVFIVIFQVEDPFLAECIEIFLGLGNNIVDLQERIIIVIQAEALRRMSAIRSQDNRIYAHAGDVVLGRIAADFFVADEWCA